MQLNSFSLNPYTPPPQFKYQLAIYDHKLAVVNTEIFVFGKNIQNFTIQTPLHKINLQTFTVQPVYTLNPPTFIDFIMFSYQQNIYFWGKTPNSQVLILQRQINQLYQFDGCKFTKIDQTGQIPSWSGHYSYTKFSSKYVLMFSCLVQDEFKIKWNLFDIKKRQWKTIISDIDIPSCQKSKLVWLNGRGYLLLSSTYNKVTKEFKKNLLYELRFKSFVNLILQLKEISFSDSIKKQNIVFTDLISFNENELYLLGGQEILLHESQSEKDQTNLKSSAQEKTFQLEHSEAVCQKISQKIQAKSETAQQKMEQEINFNQNKIVYKLDLELIQWSKDFQIIPIKGHYFEIAQFQHKIYAVGGILDLQLMQKIQFYDFRSKQNSKQISYEQSLCYYCEQAFTYSQFLINQPIVQNQYEKFCPKNQIQNKFIKKLSQSINTEFHAISIVFDFLVKQSCQQIHINLCEYINPEKNMKMAKKKIESSPTQILIFKATQTKRYNEKVLKQFFTNISQHQEPDNYQGLQIDMLKLKMASFKIGLGFLYVSLIEQGFIFVGYSSYSQIQFPESNYRSFSQNFYIIKYDKKTKKVSYSSQIQRHIIYQNVKLHFGNPQVYENLQKLEQNTTINNKSSFTDIYLIGVTNLYKKVTSKFQYSEDIKIKSIPQKNIYNSLIKYFQHLYLSEPQGLKIFLQNKPIQMIKIYEKLQELKRQKKIYQISHRNEESFLKKSENEETHFSTKYDEISVNQKKIDIVEKYKFYEVITQNQADIKKDQTLGKIFVYQNNKMIKTLQSKRKLLCGVVELTQNIQVQLNDGQFINKINQKNLMRWINHLDENIADKIESYKEDL